MLSLSLSLTIDACGPRRWEGNLLTPPHDELVSLLTLSPAWELAFEARPRRVNLFTTYLIPRCFIVSKYIPDPVRVFTPLPYASPALAGMLTLAPLVLARDCFRADAVGRGSRDGDGGDDVESRRLHHPRLQLHRQQQRAGG